MPTPTLPTSTITITTYAELHHHLAAFAEGKYPLVILIGSAGLGKTRAVKAAMAGRDCLFLENHATAFAMFEQLCLHRDQPVVLDDLDLYRDEACIRLMKSVCNTEPVRTVTWLSKHPLIGDQPHQIPASFATSSPVCLLTNQWNTTSEHVRAVEDRAIVLHFAPTVQEVHREVGTFQLQDPSVHHFIGEHLSLIPQPSIRHYVRGAQLQQANPDTWKDLLLESMGVDERMRVISLLTADQAYATEEARVQAYVNAGLGSRATYYRVKAELAKNQHENINADDPVGVDNGRPPA